MEGVLRFFLLAMLFMLLSADYSSLLSTVFASMGGTVVNSPAHREPGRASPNTRKKPTAPGDIGHVRRARNLVTGDDLNTVEDEDEEDISDVFDLAGGGTAKLFSAAGRSRLLSTMRTSCLPKLICELNAAPHRQNLGESERSLLSLIRDTSIGTTAEVTSKYHFAAHMGQLIAGVDGTGCHNFYPSCPFPGLQVLSMMKKVRVR